MKIALVCVLDNVLRFVTKPRHIASIIFCHYYWEKCDQQFLSRTNRYMSSPWEILDLSIVLATISVYGLESSGVIYAAPWIFIPYETLEVWLQWWNSPSVLDSTSQSIDAPPDPHSSAASCIQGMNLWLLQIHPNNVTNWSQISQANL